MQLHHEQAQHLLKFARDAIQAALGREAAVRPAGFEHIDNANFVTIKRAGVLHGCVGTLEPGDNILDSLAQNAVGAALRDPRATPINCHDIASLNLELSILSEIELVPGATEGEIIKKLRPDRDGVIIRFRGQRATFLPQVWENLPHPKMFLQQLKRNAGLAANFWHKDLEVWRYSVEKWSES